MDTTVTPASPDKFSLPEQLHRLRQASQATPCRIWRPAAPDLMPSRGLLRHKQALCQALARDYGQRSDYDSLIADVLPCVMQINYTLKRLKGWMKPERRHSGLLLAPPGSRCTISPSAWSASWCPGISR